MNQPGPVEYTELLREKGAGIMELKPLTEFTKNAKLSNTPLRQYKPKAGENWDDVLRRVQRFLIQLADYGLRDNVKNILYFLKI